MDDEPMLLELASVILEPLGYTVETFRSPETALRAFEGVEPKPALVITDYAMHTMTGLDLAQACRRIRPQRRRSRRRPWPRRRGDWWRRVARGVKAENLKAEIRNRVGGWRRARWACPARGLAACQHLQRGRGTEPREPATRVGERAEFHSKSNWTRPVAFGLTGLARGEHLSDGSADV